MSPQVAFDSLADRYEAYRTGYSETLYEAVLTAAPDEPRVLDVAAGTGLASQPLQDAARRVVATDVAPRMLARAPIEDRVLAAAEHLPFAAASFELVTCAQAFHWLEPEPTYRELHRVLTPEGRAAIWWKYPTPGDEVRELTDDAIEAVTGRPPPHTPLVEGPLPDREAAAFRIETRSIGVTMTYTLDDWLGYQASRSILRREAADADEHAALLAEIEQRLRDAYPEETLDVTYDQHLHLLAPARR